MDSGSQSDWKLCIAPMMACTDVHCRALHRMLSPSARLYTEMVSADALLHGGACRQMRFNEAEHPVALQLGGSDPAALAHGARVASGLGFDEINLNVGCPSERVQRGSFGACLMLEPELVADCAAAMADAAGRAPTVKCRLGVSREIDLGLLSDFVGSVADSGVDTFIVHARVAILGGLTPAQNRDVPPLRYDVVQRLAQDFADLRFVLNGGLRCSGDVEHALTWADGVMIGRGAYQNPLWLAELEYELFGGRIPGRAEDAVERFEPYVERSLDEGAVLHDLTRHMLGLFNGRHGARAFRRHLSLHARDPKAGIQVLRDATNFIDDAPARRGLAA